MAGSGDRINVANGKTRRLMTLAAAHDVSNATGEIL